MSIQWTAEYGNKQRFSIGKQNNPIKFLCIDNKQQIQKKQKKNRSNNTTFNCRLKTSFEISNGSKARMEWRVYVRRTYYV